MAFNVSVYGALGLLLVSGAVFIRIAGLEPPTVQAPTAVTVPAAAVTASDPGDPGSVQGAAVSRIDSDWAARVAAATGIPQRAVVAYAWADAVIDREQPGCGLGWNTLAAIGSVESGHGSYAGAVLGDDGRPEPAIRGIALNGEGVAAIPDTDGGALDGDAVWDRAVGPLQFIPSTWEQWGVDGDGDGGRDPNQLDDASLAAARYLCASGAMTSTTGWRAAVFSYNHSDEYVDDIAATATSYAERDQGAR